MMKLIVAFRNFANVHTNEYLAVTEGRWCSQYDYTTLGAAIGKIEIRDRVVAGITCILFARYFFMHAACYSLVSFPNIRTSVTFSSYLFTVFLL
jgi:hypothetical protein